MELLQPGREFIKEGYVDEMIRGEVQTTYYCLFNDILLRAEKKKSKFSTMRAKDKFTTFEQIPLYNVTVDDGLLFFLINILNTFLVLMRDYHVDQKGDGFELKYNKKSIKVTPFSPVEREEWLNMIKTQINKFDRDTGMEVAKKANCKSLLFIFSLYNIPI